MGTRAAPRPDGVIVAPEAVLAEHSPGHLAVPTSGEGPGILVLDGAGGLTGRARNLCERLAREGYVAYAPELGDLVAADADRAEEGAPANGGFDQLVGLLLRAVDRISEEPGVVGDALGAIGSAEGGARAMLAAELRPDRVRAVTTFCGLEPDLHYEATRAAFLGHFAANDEVCPWASAEMHLERILAAGREGTFHRYDGTRAELLGAALDGRPASRPRELAWSRTVEFLRDRLSRA